nr:hypothetical protein [Tanacetum cinerariifolium]
MIFEIGRDYEIERLNNLIENMTGTTMDGEDKYMALIPKEWTNMSNCARRNLEPGERTKAQPEDEKYTLAGLKDLKRFVRYATDALHIKSWHNGDYNRMEHMEPRRGVVGPGFGDGEGRY